MSDLYIDPLTQDYTGERITSLANAVYLRLMTPLGSYWQDTTLGSRLHLLQREKDLARVGVLAKQYSEEALQPLIKDGRAERVQVETEQPHDGRMLLHIEVTDSGGRTEVFQHTVKVI